MQSFKRYLRFVSFSAVLGVLVIAGYVLTGQQRAVGEPRRAMLNDTEIPVCVFGWSKDHCEGKLGGDSIKEYSCFRFISGEFFECKTVELHNATLKFSVESSTGVCGDAADVTCDETKKLNGAIYITGDFIFRKNGPCPYRGCWRGDWKLEVGGATIGGGTGHGTLGTGSHRAPVCVGSAAICGPDCENCYDVQFFPSSDPPIQGVWAVAFEGCLEGLIDQGEFQSSEVCAVISGVLSTKGNNSEPFNFGQWEFCGTSDGTVLAKCEG